MTTFGICGGKFHGKSTIGDYLYELNDTEKTHLATPLKDSVKAAYGLTDEQMYDPLLKEVIIPRFGVTPRVIMQNFGVMFRDTIDISFIKGDNFWVERWKLEHDHKTNVSICDIRFQNEVDFIESRGGIMIHVINDRIPKNTDTHSSEQGNLIMKNAYVIQNNGTLDDLKGKIEKLLDSLY